MAVNIDLRQGNCMELIKTIPDNSIDFVFTDIPYSEASRENGGIRNTDYGLADILTFDIDKFLVEVYRVCKNSICIFCGREQFSQIYSFFTQDHKGDGTARPIIWEKTNPDPVNSDYIYLSGIEMAVWFKKSGAKVFNGKQRNFGKGKNTVFRYSIGSKAYHPTMKNLQLCEDLILDNTNEGDTVLDTCMGSGQIGIASKKHGRNFIGFELDEEFFRIASERISTGGVADKVVDENKKKQVSLW